MSNSSFSYPAFVPKPSIVSGSGYKCPNCGLGLVQLETVPSFSCENNHNFDLAKEVYLNLHLAQHRRSRKPGDSDQMVRSRQRFLNAGYYSPLAEAIVGQLGNIPENQRLLDIGCGEGYYLEQIYQANKSLQLVGLDISKTAVRLTAKRKLNAQLAVDSAFNISLFDSGIDSAISVFSPISAAEASRVIKPSGTLIMIGPGESHLRGLTAQIYDKTMARKGNFEALDSNHQFTLLKQIEVLEEMHIEGTAIADLLHMTPYYWHAKPQQQERLKALRSLETPAHFIIRVYQNGQPISPVKLS